jgi:hypothetical protein
MTRPHRHAFAVFALAAAVVASAIASPARAQAADAAPFNVHGSGFSVHELRRNAPAFANRKYTWLTVPAQFEGGVFTQTGGGEKADLRIHAAHDADVYVASAAPPDKAATVLGPDWKIVDGVQLTYSDDKQTPLNVYRAAYKAGTVVGIPQFGWAGTIVLAPSLGTTFPPPPGVVVAHLPAADGHYVGSPSLAVLPDGTYVASHDLFGFGPTRPAKGMREGNDSRVFRSADRGKTWTKIADVPDQYWSTLFVHRGALYLLGTDKGFGNVTVRRSTDGGRTWTTPAGPDTGLLLTGGDYHCAPVPVVEHAGRLWRAFEVNPKDAKRRDFRAFVMSAPVDADLLRAGSWTRTNELAYDVQQTGGNWLEGNAVVAPDGQIVDLLRIGKNGIEKAALLHVSADGHQIAWDPAQDVVDLPGGGVKFTVRFDPTSGRYWSLVNKQKNPDAVRNDLSLISSADLRSWRVEATLLHEPDPGTAFQYPDFLIDGDDLLVLSRTAWGAPHNFHDANYLTFHRVRNFRSPARVLE